MITIANDKYLVDKEVSEICGLSIHWLRRARVEKNSPPYYKLGRKVFYKENEINEWFKNNLIPK